MRHGGIVPAVAIVVVVDNVPAGEVVGVFKSHGVGEGVDGAAVDGDRQCVAQEGAAQGGGDDDVVGAGGAPSGGDAGACGCGGGGSGECPGVGGGGGTRHGEGGGHAGAHRGGAADGDGGCAAVGEYGANHPCAVEAAAAGGVERYPVGAVEGDEAAIGVGGDVAEGGGVGGAVVAKDYPQRLCGVERYGSGEVDGFPHTLVGSGEGGGLCRRAGGGSGGAALVDAEVVGGGVLHIEHDVGEVLAVLVHFGGEAYAPCEAAACADVVG